MREEYFINSFLAEKPTKELIEEFYAVAKTASDSIEIAYAYSLFISLTFKEPEEVNSFFKQAQEIKFEWFATIANYYLSSSIPMPKFEQGNISIPDGTIDEFRINEESINTW